jgi:hypothetical protein
LARRLGVAACTVDDTDEARRVTSIETH